MTFMVPSLACASSPHQHVQSNKSNHDVEQKVATILLERGPLNYSQLTRILRVPNPSLSHAHLRGALVVLIQHNMLSHSLGPLQDLFEISQDEVVARAWFGDFIAMAEDVGGSPAKVAVQAALAQGKIRVDTLVQDARALLMEEKPDEEDCESLSFFLSSSVTGSERE